MIAATQGYFELCRVRRIPVRLHWSFPLGAVLPGLFIGFRPAQSIYLCVGYILLIGVHEAGHSIAAAACRLRVLRIDITGFGGMCWTESPRSPKAALALYSGGLVAQSLLLLVTVVAIALLGRPPTLFLNCIVFMFTFVNLILFVGNAIPIAQRDDSHPTDGFMIWNVLTWMRKNRP